MKITKVNERYVLKGIPYEQHRRGKNYAAIIGGLNKKFRFQREFLERTEFSTGRGYLFAEKPEEGQIIEVMAIYYTGGGNSVVRDESGYYQIQKDGSLMAVSSDEVQALFETVEENIEL